MNEGNKNIIANEELESWLGVSRGGGRRREWREERRDETNEWASEQTSKRASERSKSSKTYGLENTTKEAVDTTKENRAYLIETRVGRVAGFLQHVTTGQVSGWLKVEVESSAQVCERNRDVTGESRPSRPSRSPSRLCFKSPSRSLFLIFCPLYQSPPTVPPFTSLLVSVSLVSTFSFRSPFIQLRREYERSYSCMFHDRGSPVRAFSYHCNVSFYLSTRKATRFFADWPGALS